MSTWQGEIVETSSVNLVAQSYHHDSLPPFGSLLCCTVTSDLTVFAVVHDVRTTGIDPGARPVVRGTAGMRDQAIYDANPDLGQVLRTDVSALLVGYQQRNDILQVVPPSPPPLHWSAYECDADICREFCSSTGYLRTLVESPSSAVDELIGAHVQIGRARLNSSHIPLSRMPSSA